MESSYVPMKGTAGICQYRISSQAPAPLASAYIVLLVSDPDWSAERNWATARVRASKSDMNDKTYDELWAQKESYSELKLPSGYLQVNVQPRLIVMPSALACQLLTVVLATVQVNSSIGTKNDTNAVFTFTWGELH